MTPTVCTTLIVSTTPRVFTTLTTPTVRVAPTVLHNTITHFSCDVCVCAFQTKAKCQREGGTWGLPVFGVNLEICFRGIISIDQGHFDSLRGSCTAPSNKHVCFTGSLYNYVCKVWGIHNCMLHHTHLHVWTSLALQTLYPKCEGAHPVSATPIGAAVCGLMNIIMTLLSVISSVHRHDHWWFCQKEVLTSYKGNKPPDSTDTHNMPAFHNMSVKAGSIIWS